MAKDKFSAVWVSHSSIADFLACPRAYYLKNIYKSPQTKRKFQIVNPSLTLGTVIHEVVEALSILPVNKRFEEPLLPKFELAWNQVSGIKGGFFDLETEYQYRKRGEEMIRRVEQNPGPLKNLAVKIDMELPYFWLSESENIILCGKIDWLEYLPADDTVRVIDFKTSKHEEDSESLQLPIYLLLATNCQKRKVAGAAYWYLESKNELTPKELPETEEAHKKILKIAREISLARKFDRLTCPHNGCKKCEPMEKVIRGEAEFVGINSFGQDSFVLPLPTSEKRDGRIL